MNIWFTKNLGDAMFADEQLAHIKDIFLSKYNKEKSTNEMGIFYRHESVGRIHCEVMVYFSPATVCVAQAVDAIKSKKSYVDGLDLLAGSAGSWSILFP